MNCPKCGAPRHPEAMECPHCGIIYDKYVAGPPPGPPVINEVPDLPDAQPFADETSAAHGEARFLIDEAFSLGKNLFQENMGFLILMIVIMGAANLVIAILSFLIRVPVLFEVISWCVHLYLGMGISYSTLKLLRGESITMGDLFACYPFILPALVAGILFFLIGIVAVVLGASIGGLLMQAPSVTTIAMSLFGMLAIYVFEVGLLLSLMFFAYFIFDQNLGSVAALKGSWAITRGHRWELLGLMAALFCFNLIGALCLLVGLLYTLPISAIAFSHAYETLRQNFEWSVSEEI